MSLSFRLRALILAGLLAALLFGQAGAPGAGATAPSPTAQMAAAMNAARSFRTVIAERTTAGTTTVSSLILDEIAVRDSKTFSLFMTMTRRSSAGGTSVLQFVHTAQHTCARQGQQGTWQCSEALGASAGAMMALGPDQMTRSLGISRMATTSTGTTVVQGQRCATYGFAYSVKTVHVRGTLWLSLASHRPVEQKSVSSGVLVAGTPAVVSSMTVTWTRWNDPTLTIPRVR